MAKQKKQMASKKTVIEPAVKEEIKVESEVQKTAVPQVEKKQLSEEAIIGTVFKFPKVYTTVCGKLGREHKFESFELNQIWQAMHKVKSFNINIEIETVREILLSYFKMDIAVDTLKSLYNCASVSEDEFIKSLNEL